VILVATEFPNSFQTSIFSLKWRTLEARVSVAPGIKQWHTQKVFMGSFIQWHMVVIRIWCALFVTSQFDVIFMFSSEVCCHNRHILLHALLFCKKSSPMYSPYNKVFVISSSRGRFQPQTPTLAYALGIKTERRSWQTSFRPYFETITQQSQKQQLSWDHLHSFGNTFLRKISLLAVCEEKTKEH